MQSWRDKIKLADSKLETAYLVSGFLRFHNIGYDRELRPRRTTDFSPFQGLL
jgi:hypothetical protein